MQSAVPFLPYGRQSIDEADIAAVCDVLRGDMLTTGPAVEAFEADFAKAVGAAHAVSCSNGTAALHLAMLALGLGPGNSVVVPSVTFLATANAARFTGAEVVFADVDPDTGLLTPATLEDALERAGSDVRAVLPVHMAGQVADIDGLNGVARKAGALLVEDACHALGSLDASGRPVGGCAVSEMATFSLHPVKTIAAGEGGIVTTSDRQRAEAMKRSRNHGMSKVDFRIPAQAFATDGSANPWYYEMDEPGFNYRLSDIHAALARSQLSRLGQFVHRRSELVERYDELLAPLAPLVRPAGRVAGRPGWHLYVVLIDFGQAGLERATLMERLRSEGIGTQVHYLPVHRQPYYRDRYGELDLPGADSWYQRALSLPLFPAMSDSDVDRVVSALQDALGLDAG